MTIGHQLPRADPLRYEALSFKLSALAFAEHAPLAEAVLPYILAWLARL